MGLGGLVTFWIGPTVPFPAPPPLIDHLDQITVTHNDSGRSGFQLTFTIGRDRLLGLVDYPPLITQLVRAGHRVMLFATLGAVPQMLMDGIITNFQVAPGAEPNSSKLTVIGEDISVMMDLVERQDAYPGMSAMLIVNKILATYAGYNLMPLVIPPLGDRMVPPAEGTPQRNGTDLTILNDMAREAGHVFYIDSMKVPGVNVAYWGPPVRNGLPQRALTFGMGASTNVGSIQFTSDATQPKLVMGLVHESKTGASLPVVGIPLGNGLGALPAFLGNAPFVGVKVPGDDGGGDLARALAAAQAEAERSTHAALTASGELDVARYGAILRARAPVDVRGVGLTLDGTWYCKSVTHTLTRGSYKQQFNLERDGTFPRSPVVRP